METRSYKQASDADTPPPASSAGQNLQQIDLGPFSSVKIEDSKTPSKIDISQPLLSLEEIAVVMAMRSTPSTGRPSIPSTSNAYEDFRTPFQVSSAKLEASLPPNSSPLTAVTAFLPSTTTVTAKPITAKKTINWDLSTLSKDNFTLSSTLNKPRFEQLDRILRSNNL